MKKPILAFVASMLFLSLVAIGIGVSLNTPVPSNSVLPTTSTLSANAVPWLKDEQKPTLTPTGVNRTVSATDSPILPLAPQTVDAGESMRNAMKNGDPQAPVIVRDTTPVESATPDEVADPKRYAAYLARQNMRLYKQYVAAADVEIPRLQQDIAKARQMGIPADEIAKGEEKLRRIQQMRDQLASEHPEAAH